MAVFARKADFPNWRGDRPWRERVKDAQANLAKANPDLNAAIDAHPFQRFEELSPAVALMSYHRVSPMLAAYLAGIREALRPAYLCALLLWLMDGFDARFAAAALDEEFALHYADAFHRIIDQIDGDAGFAVLGKDAFMKDLWLARVVMIPAFAQVWWPHSGLALRSVAKAGFKAVQHCYLRCGGRRPFFEGHTHDPMVRLKYWNASGWTEAMRLMALALPSFPKHKGAFGAAWYYDPTLATVSPRLTYVADMQVVRGAFRFVVGPNEAALANATFASATRRRMVAEGKYTPTDYAVVWSSADLIAAYGASGSVHAGRGEAS